MAAFKNLIDGIAKVLGPTSGLDCEEVDHQELIDLMEQYVSNEADWSQFALGDTSRSYTRNLVADTNKKSNILVVVWNPGKGSPVHDHANAHCVMKMLKGSLRETTYASLEHDGDGLNPIRVKTYTNNQVTYISDKIGLHKIENASDDETAISLHLYTPPHAHNFGFNLYDERTGKKCHIKSAPLYSDRGRILESHLLSRNQHNIHNGERVLSLLPAAA